MQYELKQILDILDSDMLGSLEDANAFVAGGAITSVMTKKPINDLDIYFRDRTSFTEVLCELYQVRDYSSSINTDFGWMVQSTEKSLMFKKGESIVQLICYKFFSTPEELFESFDFTINMGALELRGNNWKFHPDFFRHNAQRYLHFNSGTDYPIVSALRVQKYKDRGYTISKAQMLKIMMTITKLDIFSWHEFKDHVGGMYGLPVEEVFDTTQPFSVEEAVFQLDSIEDKKLDLPSTDNTCRNFKDIVKNYKPYLDQGYLKTVIEQYKKDYKFVPNWNAELDPKYQTT